MTTPRFLADEDFRRSIVLAAPAPEPALVVATVRELGLSGIPDPGILEFADVHGWLVVSHDVSTMRAAAEAHVAAGLGLRGLFLVPQSRPTRPVAESLLLLWSASQAEEWQGRIVFLPL